MEIIKDILTLFLQLTATLILLFTWLPIRKTELRLSTAVFVLNLDLALRQKNYGDCECLTTCLDQIFEKPADGNGRIIYGYRSPSRGLDVIKELAEWKPIEYHGPIFPLPSSGADDKERWETELITLKRRFGFEGMPTGAHRNDKKFSFGRGPLAQLDSVLRTKYGYELGEFNWDEKPDGLTSKYYEDEPDLFSSILEYIEKTCLNNKERVKAFRDIDGATKIINIVQLKNPYYESLHNIHLRISNKDRGVMKLASDLVVKEGFSIANNASQYAHLVLGELPSKSERYCLVETEVCPLSENDIELQSDLLYRLNPEIMKRIVLIAALLSIFIGLITHCIPLCFL